MPSPARVMAGADIDGTAHLGHGTTVWGLAQIREDAVIGQSCIIGRGAYIDASVRVGDNVKIQNHALIYAPAELEHGVFVGPAAVLANDAYPRAVTPDGALKGRADWQSMGVTVREGASVGARAVVLGGVTLGRWSMVAAGAVVTKDVPDYGLVAGVPARRVGWVGAAGVPLESEDSGRWRCPADDTIYEEDNGKLRSA